MVHLAATLHEVGGAQCVLVDSVIGGAGSHAGGKQRSQGSPGRRPRRVRLQDDRGSSRIEKRREFGGVRRGRTADPHDAVVELLGHSQFVRDGLRQLDHCTACNDHALRTIRRCRVYVCEFTFRVLGDASQCGAQLIWNVLLEEHLARSNRDSGGPRAVQRRPIEIVEARQTTTLLAEDEFLCPRRGSDQVVGRTENPPAQLGVRQPCVLHGVGDLRTIESDERGMQRVLREGMGGQRQIDRFLDVVRMERGPAGLHRRLVGSVFALTAEVDVRDEGQPLRHRVRQHRIEIRQPRRRAHAARRQTRRRGESPAPAGTARADESADDLDRGTTTDYRTLPHRHRDLGTTSKDQALESAPELGELNHGGLRVLRGPRKAPQ